MKKSIAAILGLCLSISSIYAESNHKYNGKLTNHSNPNVASNIKMDKLNEKQ